MGSRVGQIRQQLGLAFAMAVCGLLSGAVSGSSADSTAVLPPQPEFRFARLAYGDNTAMGFDGFGRGGRGSRGGSWRTDAPDAEYHLLTGIRRLTRVNTLDPERDQFIAVRPGDPEIFEYPFVYGVEVGRWYLSDEEALNMREYLLRGGFLMVDDFHGSAQWEGFMESMRRVFPDREVLEIPDDHEVFHVLYDLDQKVQIPGIYALMSGQTYESDGVDPHWRGVFDDSGRLMVAINFNMDLGDAWEHADDPEYPQPLTALAYRFAISYAIYAMSH
jgi:Domain of unknown function (DUF4159)